LRRHRPSAWLPGAWGCPLLSLRGGRAGLLVVGGDVGRVEADDVGGVFWVAGGGEEADVLAGVQGAESFGDDVVLAEGVDGSGVPFLYPAGTRAGGFGLREYVSVVPAGGVGCVAGGMGGGGVMGGSGRSGSW